LRLTPIFFSPARARHHSLR